MSEAMIKKLIEMFTAMVVANEAMIAELKKSLGEAPAVEKKKRGAKAPEEAAPATPEPLKAADIPPLSATAANPIVEKKADEPTPHSEGGALTVRDVTIEMLRALATEYSDTKNFGMEAWLALAKKTCGVSQLKMIPPEMYGVFCGAMKDGLTLKKSSLTAPALAEPVKAAAPPAAAAPVKPAPVLTSAITLDSLKAAGGAFIAKNTQPAFVALLKTFGAVKISELDPAKYPAFMEALTNA